MTDNPINLAGRDTEGRIWKSFHPQHVREEEIDLETVEEIVRDHAELLERSSECVTFVTRKQNSQYSSVFDEWPEQVVLQALCPRYMDRETLEHLFSRADIEIVEDVIEASDG